MSKQDGKGNNGNVPPVAFRWQPGQTGNAAGKPPGTKNRATIFRQFLDSIYIDPQTNEKIMHPEGSEYAGQHLTVGEVLAMKMIGWGMYGDLKSAQEAFNSAYGKNPDIVISDPETANKIINPDDSPEEAARKFQEIRRGGA